MTKNARNAEGAKVLLAWLASDTGAAAYENATHRGNPLIPSTRTAQLIAGRDIVECPPDKSDELGRINQRMNAVLEAVGAAR